MSGPAVEVEHSKGCEDDPDETSKKLRFGSWNVAGMCKKAVIETFMSVVSFDVMALQEFPKATPGRQHVSADRLEGWVRQDILTYRGIGVMFRPEKLFLLKKRKVERGVWMKFLHAESGKHVWVGSVHFPKNESNDEYRRLCAEMTAALPAWDGPVLLLGDMNVDFVWRESQQDVLNVSRDCKKGVLYEVFGERGLQHIPPKSKCLNVPTFISRKSGVQATILQGKNNRSVGPDEVPAEVLQRLAEDPQSLTAVAEFFNQLLVDRKVLQECSRAIVTLLPKTISPACPADLRPITLASHVAKAFTRLLMLRLGPALAPVGAMQCAAKHRQAADAYWAVKHAAHVLREWEGGGVLLKLDIRKAYDSINRVALGKKLVEWGADHPDEAACVLELMKSSELLFCTLWGDAAVPATNGVKQGSTESPALFKRVMDWIFEQLPPSAAPILPEVTDPGVGFMDDVVLWAKNLFAMQTTLRVLVVELEKYDLVLQPSKCQLLCLGNVQPASVLVGNMEIRPLEPNTHMTILNLPIGAGVSELEIVSYLVDKARAKCYSVKHILVARSSLALRLQLLERVVLASMRWVLGTIFPTQAIQMYLNAAQIQCVREMLRVTRRDDELWVDFECRACRDARRVLWDHEVRRWGEMCA